MPALALAFSCLMSTMADSSVSHISCDCCSSSIFHRIQHQEEVLVSEHQHRTACMANSTIDLAKLRSSNTASLRSLSMSCSPVPLRAMPARPHVCEWWQQRTLAYTWQGRG